MLTPAQLSILDNHLRKENWLLNEDLIAELTDHYIQGISERLDQGMEFSVALHDIHTGFGGRKGLLKMEEEYQTQKARRVYAMEWNLVHSFMQGSHWPLSVCLFISLYIVNAFIGQEETIKSGLGVGFFYVSLSVLLNVILSGVFFYRNRREVNYAVRLPSSPVYIIAYGLSMTLLAMNKYLFPKFDLGLSHQIITVLESFLETLCLIYYAAIILSIKNVLINNRSNRLQKAP
ncbi:hypothetical protein [Spirosoma radiotolerans]|uniref:hypothetical protein n=1 Tax=Spirosoma radiotolerans TaxID=1379870 RepID=UPI000695F719|nr:hypothetical protein [Spirosoma radiotolerans]